MALNISEATWVNTLADYMLPRPRPGAPRPTANEAREALAQLADHAYKPLSAGINGDEIRRRLDDRARREAREVQQATVPAYRSAVRGRIRKGVLTCACGSTDFEYHEDYGTFRDMVSNEGGTVTFVSDFRWGEGDDDPGIVCLGCERPVASTRVKVQYS
jgi:hypothetical protein